MKGCFTTLLLALIAAFIAAFFGRTLHRERIEEVLNDRVAAEIKAAYPAVNVRYDHLTAVVTGEATSSEIEEIKSRVKDLALGNGRVHFDVSSPAGPVTPRAKMPQFTIFREGGKLTLNGTVDSAQTRAILGNEARSNLGNLEVDNQLEIGTNTAPFPSFGSAVAAVPALMKDARNARIEANPKKVVVSGTVGSDEIKKNLLDLFASEKWNNAEIVDQLVVKIPVTPTEPSTFTVVRNNDRLTLTGTVDSPGTRTMIGNAARIEGLPLDNQIQISDRHIKFPELGSALAGIPSLINSSENGKIEVTPDEITLSGMVDSSATKRSILDFFSSARIKGPRVTNQIKVKPGLPSRFTIQRDNDKLTLTGEVDTPRTKNMLGNAAGLEGLSVDNQIQVSEDIMPFPELASTITGIPPLVSASRKSKIDFSPDEIILSGDVEDREMRDKLLSFFSGENWKGPGINQDQIKVKPVPGQSPAFTIQRSNNKLTLTGTVDSPGTKTRLGNAAKIEGITVDNQIKVSDEVMSFPSIDEALAGIPPLITAAKNGKIDFTPGKVVLSGVVNNTALKEGVMGHFSAEKWENMKIEDLVTVRPPKVTPTFTWKQSDHNKAVLSGRVPNAKVRDSLVEAARDRLGADAEIVDQIVIDKNVKNEPWLMALPVFASQAMPKVEMPIINIDNKVSSISGKVPDSTVMNDVSLAFSGINPPGKLDMKLEIAKPTTPPVMPKRTVVPDVEVTGVGQRLAVTGKVPNKKTYDSIVNTILGTKDIDQLDKNLKIGEDVKEDTYLEPLPEFISNFYNGSVKKREFRLKNKELTLRGVLPSKEAKANTLALAEPLKKKGVKIIDLLTVEEPKVVVMVPKNPDPNKNGTSQPGKDPVTPPPAFDPEKGELHSIYFDTGEFHIRESQKSRAQGLLTRARETGGKIVIDGFADERGSDELNAFLSDQRANRIRNYLISNGIDQSRIVSVVGRGEVPNGNKYEEYRRTDVRIIK